MSEATATVDVAVEAAEAAEARGEELQTAALPVGEIEVRSLEKREIGALIVPWDDVVDTPIGLEAFMRGAFDHVDPKRVVLRLEHQDPPAGRGLTIENRAEGAYMTFKVSKTPRGDEILTLAADGVTPHVSVGYNPRNSLSEFQTRAGRRFTAWRKSDLREVSTTWKPYYERAAVVSVRSEQEDAPVAEEQAPAAGAPEVTPVAAFDQAAFQRSLEETLSTTLGGFGTKMQEAIDKIEERSRADFSIPAAGASGEKPDAGRWMNAVLRMLSGERVPERELQERALADIITTDNAGVVPDAFASEIIGVIDPQRPFLASTTRLDTPSAGMSLVVPRIVTRPTVDTQATEKAELESTATAIDTVSFDAVTKGGAGDISLQLLKRSSPSFLDLYLRLLAEAYAAEAEAEAISTLLAAGVNSGGVMNPEDLSVGAAWTNAQSSTFKRGPDTIWLSSAAVAEFMDAKSNGTNTPLFGTLAADFGADGGITGNIKGLRPVYVPAMDATGVDVLVGPRRGFGWAEDGTYTLQVDVPAKAGRDVALVGILWFATLYPAAFTAYSVGSGGS